MGKLKETSRYNVISMRVTDEEREELQYLALRHQINISNMMRHAMEVYTRDQREGLMAGSA